MQKTDLDYINELIAQTEAISKNADRHYWNGEPKRLADGGYDYNDYANAVGGAYDENTRIKKCEAQKRAYAAAACKERHQLPDGSVNPDLSAAQCMAMWADGIPGGKDVAEHYGHEEKGGIVLGVPGLQVPLPKEVQGGRFSSEKERTAAKGYHKECFAQEHWAQ